MNKMSLTPRWFETYQGALAFVFEFNNSPERANDDYVAEIMNENGGIAEDVADDSLVLYRLIRSPEKNISYHPVPIGMIKK